MINLKDEYGKKYKVTMEENYQFYDAEDRKKMVLQFMEIKGKRGYIRPWGETELELYIQNFKVANRIERELKQFKPKNHYEDGGSFVFDPIHMAKAVRLVQGRKRRQVTPEQRQMLSERLSQMRSKLKNTAQEAITGPQNPEKVSEPQMGGRHG